MDEKFRLVFRGELLEGQHRVVVKRRLAERLKLDDAQIEKLFSGSSVVVKRDADKKTAAHYQSVFKQAGGLLRVEAFRAEQAAAAVPGREPVATASNEQAKANARLRAIRPGANPELAAPDFTVQSSYFPSATAPAEEIQAPDYAVAEAGALLGEPVDRVVSTVAEVNFELAERGADLLERPREKAPVELGPLDFELAEVGADLGPGPRAQTATAPDVSHLALIEA
ncbi:MAG TPA: hypothetical protein VIS76_13780 [Pseudomonadales bacterium]